MNTAYIYKSTSSMVTCTELILAEAEGMGVVATLEAITTAAP